MNESQDNSKSIDCRFQSGVGALIGRVLVALLFLLASSGLIVDFKGGIDSLKEMGMIDGEIAYITCAILLQAIASFMLIIGAFTRTACYMLIFFLGLLTIIFHSFWTVGGNLQALQFSLFLKNIALIGALIFIASMGPGKWSFDAYWQTRKTLKS